MSKKPPVSRRPCSELENSMAEALSKVKSLSPFDKRYNAGIFPQASSELGISDRQREILFHLVIKYRRQIPKFNEFMGQIAFEFSQLNPVKASDI